MDIIEFIQAWVKSGMNYGDSEDGRISRRSPAYGMECKDGFYMSVQASSSHDCIPRCENGPYTHFEVGFPSECEEIIREYSVDPDSATAVYSYVPLEAIVYIIVKHGGLNLEAMLKQQWNT